jgi:hypothetical protein
MAFPPRHVAQGLFRLRTVASVGFGLGFVLYNERFLTRGCYRAEPGSFDGFMCLGGGMMGMLIAGAIVAGLTALALWTVYRVVLWVWRGFRGA